MNKKTQKEKETLHKLHFLLENIQLGNNSSLELGNITSLNLSHCDLSELPRNFKFLKLKTLDLSHNNFKNIPLCFLLGLQEIEDLNLSWNHIESFDNEPQCCSNLKSLNLKKNKFCSVPQWILSLRAPKLEIFDYSFNEVRKLQCLFDTMIFPTKKLIMQNSIIIDADFPFFKNIPRLEYLDLSNDLSEKHLNRFEDIDQMFVKPLWEKMKVLKLNNLDLSIFPEGILWLQSLEELHVVNNTFSWLPNDGFQFLYYLEIVDVSQNSISCLPEQLSYLENLKVLKASYNKLEIVPDFSRCTKLEILDLYSNCLQELNWETSFIKYVDLEQNFFKTETLNDLYEPKKDLYRNTFEIKDRTNGMSYDSAYESQESNSRSQSSDEDELDVEYNTSFIDTTEENWDEDQVPTPRNLDVTPSDDEWLGAEENARPFLGNSSRIKIYNEDWYYCDAEDS